MEVTLLDHMGSDITVVNAARVSFAKASSYREDASGWHMINEDIKLIEYLAKHGHWSPFTHATVSFRIKAPIFVARQLAKHQVGLSWNEVSRRYVDSEPEFYCPDKGQWRLKAVNVKQGSSGETLQGTPYEDTCGRAYTPRALMKKCVSMYTSMIDKGICPEQARMVLPQSMYTEWIWTGNLYAFSRVCNLRLDSHTQRETQVIARKIADHMLKLFPVSWRVLCTH